jgi:site-specific recombinase XerD
VTQLRQKMLEELQRRNYSHRTAKTYVRIVREFATYFHRPPDKLGPEQIRQYQAHLFQSKKLTPATVSQYVSALRFFLSRHCIGTFSPSTFRFQNPASDCRSCSARRRWLDSSTRPAISITAPCS